MKKTNEMGFFDIQEPQKKLNNIVLLNSINFTLNTYKVSITRDITDPDDFLDEINFFDSLTENDTVNLVINTYGGNLNTALLLSNAIKNCPAKVIGHIGIDCASAGTAIALSCDDIVLNEFSTFMIHDAEYGLPNGNSEYMENILIHNKQLLKDFITHTYRGFLTQAEITKVINGKEIYLRSKEIRERWDRMKAPKRKTAKKVVKDA